MTRFSAGQQVRLISMQEILRGAYDRAISKTFIEVPPVHIGSIGTVKSATIGALTEVDFKNAVLWCSSDMLEPVKYTSPLYATQTMFPVSVYTAAEQNFESLTYVELKGLITAKGAAHSVTLHLELKSESELAQALRNAVQGRKTYKLTLEETGEVF